MTTDERVLVVGGTGMLGHKVWQVLQHEFETWVTLRNEARHWPPALFPSERAIPHVSAENIDTVVRACAIARPTVLINCVGIIKQVKAATDPLAAISINALFPHRLAAIADAAGARTIHISTDCVFSGRRGNYSERDEPDAYDLYGRTKLLGEVAGPGRLTLRTSIIGRELTGTTGLTEWLLSHRGGRVKGYTRACFSGLTTRALSSVICRIIRDHGMLHGLYHLASQPITKYDLICRLNRAYGAGIEIEPADDVQIDRSLDGSRFSAATGIVPSAWTDMITDMVEDPTPYDDWRQACV